MMTDKVLCPRCGNPMECSEPRLSIVEETCMLWYICGYRCQSHKCGWSAPVGFSMTPRGALSDAREKAMNWEDYEYEVSPND